MAQKRQLPVPFTLTPNELALIKMLLPTALQNARHAASKVSTAEKRSEMDAVADFGIQLQQLPTDASLTLQVQPAVIYWLDSVMNQFREVGGAPINVEPFTADDVRLLKHKLIEPFTSINGSFLQKWKPQ